mmetsp:Transcript_10549/g.23208  ORF Transcript_10549/g.23208 Transcript_10549/m.23208 type:complete len:92 (+) Transcript_10549:3274-3549(+)
MSSSSFVSVSAFEYCGTSIHQHHITNFAISERLHSNSMINHSTICTICLFNYQTNSSWKPPYRLSPLPTKYSHATLTVPPHYTNLVTKEPY